MRVPELAGPGAATCSKRWESSPPRARTSTAARIRGASSDVPEALRAAVAAILDGGDLPGTPSTVLDLTGPEPRVLREGAVPAAEALARAE